MTQSTTHASPCGPKHGTLGFCQVRRFEFPGERAVIRDRSVKAALQMLRFAMMGVSETPLIWEAPRQASI